MPTNEPQAKSTLVPGVARRRILTTAAWTAPAVAVAVAAPRAAASTGNATVAWTDRNTSLAQLRLLDEGGVLSADVLPTIPQSFTINNGAGAIDDPNVQVTVVVDYPNGINISLGRTYGFGVGNLDGLDVASQNQTNYRGIGNGVGAPRTTFSGTLAVNVAANAPLRVPVEFGLSGVKTTLVDLSLLASYPVSLTLTFSDGSTTTASSSIDVPVGAGVL